MRIPKKLYKECKSITETCNEKEKIMVSIICNAFNHEKYIEACIKGFLSQMVNFKVEILIHDDASTDKTKEIIKKYESKYPNLIKPIYQIENQYKKHLGISKTYQWPRAQGKYLAICEGDDFWSYPYKLFEQVFYLEHNTNCDVCLHKVKKKYVNSSTIAFLPQKQIKTDLYSDKDFFDFFSKRLIFQTSCFLFKKEKLVKIINDYNNLTKRTSFGDFPLLCLLINQSNWFYINKTYSTYNYGTESSWTTRYNKKTVTEKIKELNNSIVFYNSLANIINEASKIYLYKIISFLNYRKNFITDNFDIIFLNKEYKKYLKKDSLKTYLVMSIKRKFPYVFNFLRRIKNG